MVLPQMRHHLGGDRGGSGAQGVVDGVASPSSTIGALDGRQVCPQGETKGAAELDFEANKSVRTTQLVAKKQLVGSI